MISINLCFHAHASPFAKSEHMMIAFILVYNDCVSIRANFTPGQRLVVINPRLMILSNTRRNRISVGQPFISDNS